MIVDLFLVYQFVKRLATPFKEWKAYELGIIDENGNRLKKMKEFTTRAEKDAFGRFDLLITKLKQLIEKIPGGKTRIGTYAAALYLIKEHQDLTVNDDVLCEEYLDEKLDYYIEMVDELELNTMFEEAFSEDAPANSAGSGNIAGIGVGPDGEPGVSKKEQEKIKNKKKETLIRRALNTKGV